MLEYILQMGPMGELNIIILAFVIVVGLKNAYLLFIKKSQENLSKLGRSINAMLFWGAIIVILGFLGAFLGFQGAIDSVMEAKVEAILLLAAIFILLKLVIFSLTSFMCISLVWYLFTWQHRRLLEISMKEKYSAE